MDIPMRSIQTQQTEANLAGSTIEFAKKHPGATERNITLSMARLPDGWTVVPVSNLDRISE